MSDPNRAKVWGRLTLEGDEHPIAIRDKRLALWVSNVIEREPKVRQAFAELDDYRREWQELASRHRQLERSVWCRVGRWLRLAPAARPSPTIAKRALKDPEVIPTALAHPGASLEADGLPARNGRAHS